VAASGRIGIIFEERVIGRFEDKVAIVTGATLRWGEGIQRWQRSCPMRMI
jgi:hypothetical protein